MAEDKKDNIGDIHMKSRNWLCMQNQGRLEMLTVKRHALHALVKALIKEEVLERADVKRIMQSLNELGIRMSAHGILTAANVASKK